MKQALTLMRSMIYFIVFVVCLWCYPEAQAGVPLTEDSLDSLTMYALDDFVVTGIKEETSLRVEPISSTSIGATQLQHHNVMSLKDVAGLVPNFMMIDRDTPHTSSVIVRGVGSKLRPAVVMYVDGVPHFEKSTFDITLNDVATMEFLRGPQGTAYGRNAMGGVILVQTRSPFKYQGNRVGVGYGRFNEVQVNVSHLDRLGEHWAYSLSGNYQHNGGFMTNEFDGSKADKADKGALSGKLEYSPSANTLWRLTQSLDLVRQGAYTYGVLEPGSRFVSTVNLNHPSQYTRKMYDGGLSVSHHAPAFLLKGQISSHLVDALYDVDQDGTAKDIADVQQAERQKLFSEELTFEGKGGSWYQWRLGAFAFQHEVDRDVQVNMKASKPVDIHRTNDSFTWGVAAFHESEFAITEALRLQGGLRLDYEKSHLGYTEARGAQEPKESESDLAFVQVSPKVSLQYFFVPHFQVYTTISKGYVTGGFNTVYIGDDHRTFGAEQSWNYEVGTKGDILPHKLSAELVLFAVVTKDKQLNKTLGGVGQITYNAGTSRSLGVESSLNAKITKDWNVSGSYGYTHAVFTGYVSEKGVDYRGKFLPFVPRHTVALNSDYTLPLESHWLNSVTLHVGYKGIGDMYWHEDNSVKQEFYSLLDASVALKRGMVTCSLWGTNLLNTKYLGYFYTQSNRNMGKPGAPIKGGVTLEVRF